MSISKVITFDVITEETKTYGITEEEFSIIKKDYKLDIDFKDITKYNVRDLYMWLDESHVNDSEVHKDYIYKDTFRVEDRA